MTHDDHIKEAQRIMQDWKDRGFDFWEDAYCVANILKEHITDSAVSIAQQYVAGRDKVAALLQKKDLPQA